MKNKQNKLYLVTVQIKDKEVTHVKKLDSSSDNRYKDCVQYYRGCNEDKNLLSFWIEASCISNAIIVACERLDVVLENKDDLYKEVFKTYIGFDWYYCNYINYFTGEVINI